MKKCQTIFYGNGLQSSLWWLLWMLCIFSLTFLFSCHWKVEIVFCSHLNRIINGSMDCKVTCESVFLVRIGNTVLTVGRYIDKWEWTSILIYYVKPDLWKTWEISKYSRSCCQPKIFTLKIIKAFKREWQQMPPGQVTEA